jgi:hypothetical protein
MGSKEGLDVMVTFTRKYMKDVRELAVWIFHRKHVQRP